jgi:crossover junction endodeoxyribonuclease RuvC
MTDHVKVVGVDLSLASTGLAAVVPATGGLVDRVQTAAAGQGLIARRERLRTIRGTVRSWTAGADLVVVEGLAYASQSPHATERAGLWWMVVDGLIGDHVPVAVVSPTARAKYATGRGNAGKDQVLAAVVRRYPDVEVSGNDEADALTLAAMGARWLGRPIEPGALPQTHIVAMTKAAWPTDSPKEHTHA